MKVTFVVNGYRLSKLVKDPAAVDRSLAGLAEVLADARAHMMRIGRHDLADRLGDLSHRLRTSGKAIDDAFDLDCRRTTLAAADACAEAAGPGGMRSPDDENAQIYQALAWSVVKMVTVRIGGRGAFEHPGGGPRQDR